MADNVRRKYEQEMYIDNTNTQASYGLGPTCLPLLKRLESVVAQASYNYSPPTVVGGRGPVRYFYIN